MRSRHAVAAGSLAYLRCLCGAWLVVSDGTVLGATEGSFASAADLPRAAVPAWNHSR